MKKARAKRNQKTVAVEISQNDLTMAVVNPDRGTPRVCGHHMAWQQGANSLKSEDGMRELENVLENEYGLDLAGWLSEDR